MQKPFTSPKRRSSFVLILAALGLFAVASVCRLNLPAGEPGVAWVSDEDRSDSPTLAKFVEAGGNALLSAVGTWKVYDFYAVKVARWEPAPWAAREADAEPIYSVAWPFASGWKYYH